MFDELTKLRGPIFVSIEYLSPVLTSILAIATSLNANDVLLSILVQGICDALVIAKQHGDGSKTVPVFYVCVMLSIGLAFWNDEVEYYANQCSQSNATNCYAAK